MVKSFCQWSNRRRAPALVLVFLCGAAACLALQQTNLPAPEARDKPVAPLGPAAATNGPVKEGLTRGAAGAEQPARSSGRRTDRDAVVGVGGNAVLQESESAEAVVAIGGDAVARGKVRDAVVAVFGNAEVSGEVGHAVVAVMGNVKLLPGAKVGGQVVAVGGVVERAPEAQVGGHVQEINLGALGLPRMDWLNAWFRQCVLKLRPLAPGVGWVWAVAGVHLLVYLLVAIAFPGPVRHCVEELTRRPATTFLIGLMTKLLMPVLTLILVATGLGVFVVPFLLAALLFAGILGKAALLEYFGQQLGRVFRRAPLNPLLALILGATLLVVLYVVPVVGLLALLMTGMWALGAAVTALYSGTRREMPEPAPMSSSLPPAAYVGTAAANPPGTVPPAGIAPLPATAPGAATPAATAPPTLPPLPLRAPPPLAEACCLPRAGFWERMGAGFLDLVLVSLLGSLVGGPPLGLLVALAYFAGMWTWKGTTIGGIVLKLKVVRLDGQPVTFPVALVRGLAAAFSVVVFFLGFLWVAWDKDKQGWHDKIAGTVVVRLPQAQPLVCF